jgi:hypothetical protein
MATTGTIALVAFDNASEPRPMLAGRVFPELRSPASVFLVVICRAVTWALGVPPLLRKHERMSPDGAEREQSDVHDFAAGVPLARAYWIFFTPLLLVAWVGCVALLLAFYSVVWTFLLSPVDTAWLPSLFWAIANVDWWTAVAPAVASQSPWVLPSLLATTLGLCAGIYAVSRPPAHRRLGTFAVLTAIASSTWAWMSVPALWLSDNPVLVWAGLLVATTTAIIGGEAGAFVRTRLSKDRLIELIGSLQRRVYALAPQGWRTALAAPTAVVVLWLLGWPVLLATIQIAVFTLSNQAGVGIYLVLHILIAGVVLPLAWLAGQPVLETTTRRLALGLIARGAAAFAVFALPTWVGLRFFFLASEMPPDAQVVGWAPGIAYIAWGALLAASVLPAIVSVRPASGVAVAAQPSRGRVERITLAGAARDLALAQAIDHLRTVREQLVERFPDEPQANSAGGLARLIRGLFEVLRPKQ